MPPKKELRTEPSPPRRTQPTALLPSPRTANEPLLWEEVAGGKLRLNDPPKEVLLALNKVGDDDPAVVLAWRTDTVVLAVTALNAVAAAAMAGGGLPPLLPPWYPPGAGYPLSVEQVQVSIAMHLAAAGSGGLFQHTLLAPNTLLQCIGIQQRISHLMLADPFVAMLCGAPAHRPLAQVFVIADKQAHTTGVAAPPLALPPGFGVAAFA